MSPQLYCADCASIFLGDPNITYKLREFHKNGGSSGTTVWITPPCCLQCDDQPESRSGRCRNCWQKLPFIRITGACPALGHPPTRATAFNSSIDHPVYHDAIVPLAYDNPVNELLWALKHRQHPVFRSASPALWSMPWLPSEQKRPDMLYAVPIKSRTRRKKGQNQSIFIVRFISRGLGIPLCAALLRKDPTHRSAVGPPQQKIVRQPHDNPFACERRLDGRHVALIDDILTTGATANEISKILQAPGAVRGFIGVCANRKIITVAENEAMLQKAPALPRLLVWPANTRQYPCFFPHCYLRAAGK